MLYIICTVRDLALALASHQRAGDASLLFDTRQRFVCVFFGQFAAKDVLVFIRSLKLNSVL